MSVGIPVVASVTLTNAQIKALPTTPVTVVAAPGVGKIVVPVHASFVVDTTAGAYAADDGSSWLMMYEDSGSYVGNPRPIENVIEDTPGVYHGVIPCVFYKNEPADFSGAVTGEQVVAATSSRENKAVQIKDDWSGVSDYTGGNAANTLSVWVLYHVVTI